MLEETSTIVAILVGLLVLSKAVRKYITLAWNKTIGHRSLMLDEILAELRPNGGNSIRDSLNRIENRQSEFEAYLNASTNIVVDAVFRADINGLYTQSNRAYQNLTGYSMAEVLGEGWINTIAPEERDTITTKWFKAIKAQRDFTETVTIMTPKGERVKTHITTFKEVDSSGQVRGFLGLITECQCNEQ